MVGCFVAGVDSAGNAIVAVRVCPILTAEVCVAGFHAVAILSILTEVVVRRVYASVLILIAGVDGAANGVSTGWRAGVASVRRMARFSSGAERMIVTQFVTGGMNANVVCFIACVDSTGDTVVATERCPGAGSRDANIADGAKQPVIARTAFISRQCFTDTRSQVTDADGAICFQSAAIKRCSDTSATQTGIHHAANVPIRAGIGVIGRENATECRVASIIRTGIAVAAQRMLRAMRALINKLIAHVQGARNIVVTIWRQTRLT